jgi:hypothetical protein
MVAGPSGAEGSQLHADSIAGVQDGSPREKLSDRGTIPKFIVGIGGAAAPLFMSTAACLRIADRRCRRRLKCFLWGTVR